MPTSISRVHTWTATTDVYFMMPGLSDAAEITSIHFGLQGSSQLQCQIWFGLTSVDQANSSNMVAAGRLIDRGNIINDEKPSIQMGAGVNNLNTFDLPIFHRLANTNLRLMIGLGSANIATKNAFIVVVLKNERELEGEFGIGRIIQAAGQTPGPIGPPSGGGAPGAPGQ